MVGAVQVLKDGNKEGEGLAAARLRGAQDIAALQRERDGALLDVGQGGEVT
ncbi:MAG: hypothetical protein INR71_09670 [Terriglobus roseus]|nr:hypothetical protein [Terriglobus roseus]